MRVAVIVGDYPRWSERFILRDAAGLAARGHSLRFWPVERRVAGWLPPLPHDAEPGVSPALPAGAVAPFPVPAARRAVPFSRLAALAALGHCGLAQTARFWGGPGRAGVSAAAAAWPDGEPPDIVWAHFAYVPLVFGLALARGWGCGLAASVHARDIWVPWRPGWRALAAAEVVIGCHAAILDEIRRRAAPAPWTERLRLCHHGLPLADYPAPDFSGGADADAGAPARPFRLLAVARLSEKKGLDALIDALSRLRDDGLEIQLDIVGALDGGGPGTAEYWRELAGKHGWTLRPPPRDAAPRVLEFIDPSGASAWRVRGAESQAELRRRMRAADLFAMPSRIARDGDRDGIPNVVLEAMASGLAVAATEVGGLPEALGVSGSGDCPFGLLAPPDDAAALAGALAALWNDPARRRRLAAAARRHVEDGFDLALSAARLEKCLAAAARGKIDS